MLKVSSSWVPTKVTSCQKQCRVQFYEKNFGVYEADPETFLLTVTDPSLG
jgi:hypothetical protein